MYNIYDCEGNYICSIAKENAEGNIILEVLKNADFIIEEYERRETAPLFLFLCNLHKNFGGASSASHSEFQYTTPQ